MDTGPKSGDDLALEDRVATAALGNLILGKFPKDRLLPQGKEELSYWFKLNCTARTIARDFIAVRRKNLERDRERATSEISPAPVDDTPF